jgi:hypothetical protein
MSTPSEESSGSVSSVDAAQIEHANAKGETPVVFIHGVCHEARGISGEACRRTRRTLIRRPACIAALAAVAVVGFTAEAAPAEAANRLVLSPAKGQVTHNHRVAIRVRSSDRVGALSVRLNGRQIGDRFGPSSRKGVRRLSASISDGLRARRNVLKVRVRRRYRPARRATVRFQVRRDSPLVGAGPDRRVVAGAKAHVHGEVSQGQRSNLRWRVVRAPGRRAAVGATTDRASTRPVLGSRRGRTARFRPPTPGRYVLELGHPHGDGTVKDRVALSAVPPTPLVPIDTGTANEPITVNGQSYPIRPDLPHFIQMIVLDRKTLKFVSHNSYPDDGNQLLADLSDPKKFDKTKLVIVSTRVVYNYPFADNVTKALESIGVPDLGGMSSPVQAYAAVGIPGLKPGSADYAVSNTTRSDDERMRGYLSPDQYENYRFVSPVAHEVQLGADDPLPCDSSQSCNVSAGYQVTIRDRYRNTPVFNSSQPTAFETGGGSNPTQAAQDMTALLNSAPSGSVISVQAVSTLDGGTYRPPVGGVARQAMVDLASAIAAAGGTRNAFNRAAVTRGAPASNGHVYNLVGWAGAGEAEGVEAAAGVDAGGDAPSISATLRPGRNSQLRPSEAELGDDRGAGLVELAMEPVTSGWPLDDRPGALLALSWLGKQDERLGPDPRGAYWTQELDTNALITKLTPIGYPGKSAGFTKADFTAAKAELLLELGWVGNVNDYIAQISQPFAANALTSWAAVQNIADTVKTDADPDAGQVGVNWLEITDAILGLIPLFGPEEQAATHTAHVIAGVGEFALKAWGAAGEGGEPTDGEVTVEADRLGQEIMNQAQQAEATFQSLEDVILSDYQKLSTLGPHAGCNPTDSACPSVWAYSKQYDQYASANIYLGISQVAYLKLVPLGFRVFSLVRENAFQSHIVRPTAPNPVNYHCLAPHPWSEYPDIARSSTSLLTELDPVGGDNGWDTFVFSRFSASDLHGTPPTKSLLDTLFNPVTQTINPADGGMGLFWSQFATPEVKKAVPDREYWQENIGSEQLNCGWSD